MVIGIFGESCTGKSTLAETLQKQINAELYTGKDYLRFAKNAEDAKKQFCTMLQESMCGQHLIYVIAEKEHLAFLPEKAIRILVTADLQTIKERFAKRLKGNLPKPVEMMLEKKHGCFDQENYDFHVISETGDVAEICNQIVQQLQ